MNLLRLFVLCLTLILAGCDQKSSGNPNERVPVVDSEFRVGVVPAPPISAIDPGSLQPKGYAIDLLNALAQRSGIKIDYQAVDWSNMAAAVQSSRVDVIVGPIFRTEARAKEFIFTEAIWSYAIVGVKKKNNDLVNSFDDLVQKPIRIAVGRGGFDHEFASRVMRKADIRVLPPENPDASMLEVLAGRTDVALVDRATAKRFMTQHRDLSYVADGRPISLQLAAFMLSPNKGRLREFLDVALENLAVSGEMAALADPYQQADPWEGLPLVERYRTPSGNR